MKKIKLISIDLDGTLFNSSGTVDEASIRMLFQCKARGIQLVFNTARPLKMIPTALYGLFPDDYWVFSNGTTCMRGNKSLFHITIDVAAAGLLIRTIHYSYPSFFLSIESDGQIYTAFEGAVTCRKYFAESVTIDQLIIKTPNKILVIAENRNFPMESIVRTIDPGVQVLVTEKGKYIQFMPRGISKLSAIRELVKMIGIGIDNVLSFGDDLNDLELIKASGIGVAMGNADVLVKQQADFVTISNDNMGVAFFLREFMSE